MVGAECDQKNQVKRKKHPELYAMQMQHNLSLNYRRRDPIVATAKSIILTTVITYKLFNLLFAPHVLAPLTCVESGHRLVCASCLLHSEQCAVELALGTCLLGSVGMFHCIFTTNNILYILLR